MRYKIEGRINDGLSEAPPIFVEVAEDFTARDMAGGTMVRSWGGFIDVLEAELCNDYGDPFGAGFTLTVERVA